MESPRSCDYVGDRACWLNTEPNPCPKMKISETKNGPQYLDFLGCSDTEFFDTTTPSRAAPQIQQQSSRTTGVSLRRGTQAESTTAAGGGCGASKPRNQGRRKPPWGAGAASGPREGTSRDRVSQYRMGTNMEALDRPGRDATGEYRITDRIGAASRP